MIRSDMVTRIRNALGYNTGLNVSIITTALDDAQEILEQAPELPWFLETEISSISTVVNEERIQVPDDFIRESVEAQLWYYDEDASVPWTPLGKSTVPALRQWYNESTEDSGKPVAYALQGDYFRIFPTPDAVYMIKLIYYGKQDLLTGDGDSNKWSIEAPWALIGRAGMIISGNNKDEKSKAEFQAMFTEAMQLLTIRSEAREHAGHVYQRGGED